MAKKSLKVDRKKFEGIVKNLLDTKPVKREDVKIKNRKNREQLIPPQKGTTTDASDPPSITSSAPVMKLDSSEARKRRASSHE